MLSFVFVDRDIFTSENSFILVKREYRTTLSAFALRIVQKDRATIKNLGSMIFEYYEAQNSYLA